MTRSLKSPEAVLMVGRPTLKFRRQHSRGRISRTYYS